MTHSRREELRKMLPKVKSLCYQPDCLKALEGKVILRSELLSVEEIRKIIEIYMIENNCCIGQEYIIEIAQQIHDRQEGR